MLRVFLGEQLTSGCTVYVAIDRTTWGDINLLMASIVWKGRAIPLYWQRMETLGNSHYDEQTAFLSVALPILASYRVVVLGDREFCSVDLARWLGQQGHYFCLRQKKSTYVLIEDKPWLKLSQLGLGPGTKCFYNAVTMTRSKGFDQAHLAGKWKRQYRGFAPEEPWFLLTNLETLSDAVAAYQKRFDIEMCQPQYTHKNEIDFIPPDWIDGIIAISKSDRENESTFPPDIRGRAFMPKRHEPPRLPVCEPRTRTCGRICRSRSGNG